jgi:hypothetical protein
VNFVCIDIMDKKTPTGKVGDAISTQRIYKCMVLCLFLSELDEVDVDICTEIYLPGKANFVNRMIVRHFIQCYINQTTPTTSHISEALMLLQRKLSNAMNASGEIPREGLIWEDTIWEDTWVKDFTKDMLVKVANSEDMQLQDHHADMDRQITRSDQLHLVDCCLPWLN